MADESCGFHDVCLITSLRNLGVALPYTVDGPFRALSDGNKFLMPMQKQLVRMMPGQALLPGLYVVHHEAHFVAVKVGIRIVIIKDGARVHRVPNVDAMTDAQGYTWFRLQRCSVPLGTEAFERTQANRSAALDMVRTRLVCAASDDSNPSVATLMQLALTAEEEFSDPREIPSVLQLEARHAHPKDARITLRESDHKYFLNARIQFPISVSGVWASYFEQFDAGATVERYFHKWASQPSSRYFQCINELRADGLVDDWIKARIVQTWKEAGELASASGTTMHRSIELYLNGISYEQDKPEMQQFEIWLQSEITPKGWKPFRTEWSVFDCTNMVAGQIDSVWIDPVNGEFHMIDWKRCRDDLSSDQGACFGKYGLPPCDFLLDNKFNHYAVQQNLYAAILKKHYHITLSSMWLVQLHPDRASFAMLAVPDFTEVAAQLLQNAGYELDCLGGDANIRVPLLFSNTNYASVVVDRSTSD